MKVSNRIWVAVFALALATAGCSRKDEQAATEDATGGAAGAAGTPAGQAAKGAGSRSRSGAPGSAASERGAAPASGWGTPSREPAGAPPRRQITVASGTPLQIRTNSAISTKTAQSGQKFDGVLAEDLVVDGYTVARRGAGVTGEVIESDPGGRVKGVASIAVTLRTLETVDHGTVDIRTDRIGREAPSSKKKDALKIGIGAAVGSAIGAIAGGGKGAAIGAGAGAAGGTGVVLATRGDPAVIPAESLLSFPLTEPFTVTKK